MDAPRAAITTILFTDLVSSTELMQQVGDENAQGLFQAHHQLLQDTVTATGGDELQWMGDGLMVAFASTADAVRCAVAMQQAARQQIGGHELPIRVGLNVGETLQQESGSGYFGTPVVISKRLCDLAEAGQILCTSTVSGLLAGRAAFRFEDLGPAELKGIAEPVGISEVVYETEQSTPVLRQTPFVGRGDEIARLDDALERARAGAGSLLMVVGEPGIGKTRTLEEFCTAARERGGLVLWGGCYEGDRDPPYCPFVEAIAEHARRADPKELEKDLGPYGGIVAKLVPELRDRIPGLPEPGALAPEEERHRLLDATSQFLLALADRVPVVLVLDDIHWADHGTIALLRQLSRFVARHPILVIGAYRDVELDRQHPLSDALAVLKREAEYERIVLRGLGSADVSQLLETLASHEVSSELGEAIHHETDGNPFFIREVILHLVEEGKLYRRDGRWRSDFQIEELGIPEGVRQVIGRRLSRLSPEANKLLSAASGFNGSFRFDIAAAASRLDEMEALDALDEALEAQLLRPAGGAEWYDFTHALIRHTLYAEMNPSRQVRMHRRIAVEMERALGEDAGEHAGEIAQQFQRSAVLPGAEKGVAHCLAAADRAEAALAFEESVVFLRMALELLGDDERRPRVLGRLAMALARSLVFEEAVDVASDASERIAASEGDDAAAAYLAEASNVVWQSGWTPLAWRLAGKGMEYVGDRRDLTWADLRLFDIMRRESEDPDFPGMPPDSPERRELSDVILAHPDGVAWLSQSLIPDSIAIESREMLLERLSEVPGLASFQAGQYGVFMPFVLEQTEVALREGRLAGAALLYTVQARCLTALGELEASREAFAKSVALSERFRTVPFLVLQMGAYPLEYGLARGEGLELLVDAVAASLPTEASENYWVRGVVKAAISVMASLAGRDEQAMTCLEEALPAVEAAGGWATNYPLLVGSLCFTLWNLERTDHIDILERNLLEKIVEPDFRYIHQDGRLAMAQLCALQKRHAEAIEWFAKARVVLEEEGGRPLRARIDYEEARMYMRRDSPGDRERALGLLASAIEQFRALDMVGWVPRAETLVAELS